MIIYAIILCSGLSAKKLNRNPKGETHGQYGYPERQLADRG